MDSSLLVPVIAAVIAIVTGGYLLYQRYSATQRSYRGLMAAEQYSQSMAELRQRIQKDESGEELDRLRRSVVKEKKKGKGTRGDCLKCCDEFKDVEVDQKELREFSCNNFKLECADNLQTGQPSEMLYWGLIAMWRCDQWPKQAEKKFKECQKACGRSFQRPMRRR